MADSHNKVSIESINHIYLLDREGMSKLPKESQKYNIGLTRPSGAQLKYIVFIAGKR